MRPPRSHASARQGGLSLVELMVGMLVGLIGIIIISQMYVTNEQYKRSTTGAGTAQVNGAIALYTLERELRMAGYGINHADILGCSCVGANCSPLQYYFSGAYSSPPAGVGAGRPPLRVAPVVIDETPNQADRVTLLSGTDNERTTPLRLLSMGPPDYDFNGDGTAGFDVARADLVIVTDRGATCALAQVTPDAATKLTLVRIASPFNPGGKGDLPAFSRDAAIFNLGAPIWRTYSIANNKLRVTEVLGNLADPTTATQELVDDIIDMQVMYGKDTNDDPNRTVDVWNKVMPTTSAGWQQVYAVRIAVLARSKNYEKGATPGVCDATTAANQPKWAIGEPGPVDPLNPNLVSTAGLDFPVLDAALATAGSEAGCYKYRAFETVVPLRNMIWR